MAESSRNDQAWSVRVSVHDVPEAGRHYRLVADEHARATVARLAEVRSLPRLEATFEVTRRGRDGLHVLGRVSATVGQTCVVTLDPIENEIEDSIDVVFAPEISSPVDKGEIELTIDAEDGPEPLVGGAIDLGVIATEFLILAIDPHARKPGAVFEPPAAGDEESHPFAALAALRKEPGPQ
jgi:hypothetical protein